MDGLGGWCGGAPPGVGGPISICSAPRAFICPPFCLSLSSCPSTGPSGMTSVAGLPRDPLAWRVRVAVDNAQPPRRGRHPDRPAQPGAQVQTPLLLRGAGVRGLQVGAGCGRGDRVWWRLQVASPSVRFLCALGRPPARGRSLGPHLQRQQLCWSLSAANVAASSPGAPCPAWSHAPAASPSSAPPPPRPRASPTAARWPPDRGGGGRPAAGSGPRVGCGCGWCHRIHCRAEPPAVQGQPRPPGFLREAPVGGHLWV